MTEPAGAVELSEEEVEAIKELRSRIHADASLASTAADTAGPLLFSSNTEVWFYPLRPS